MPWQRMVADVALELLPDGLPAYRDVIVTVPRQQGKTTLVLAVMLHRALMWPSSGRQRIFYSAQTGKDAKQKLLDDYVPVIQASPLAQFLDSRRANGGIRRESGGEGIDFRGGNRIDCTAGTIESGHGKTAQLAVMDEAFKDTDDRREQAMIPAMMTVQDAQQWTISTAGWAASTFLKRKVDTGRGAVADGLDEGICYFEWSSGDDEEIADPATWWGCMPALGYTVTESIIRKTLLTWKEGPEEFMRAFLNRWTTGEARIIPKDAWDAVIGQISPDGRLCLGVDATPDGSAGSIVVADGKQRCELVEHRGGRTWMVERLQELATKYDAKVAIDVKGPAASLIPDLESTRVPLVKYGADEMAGATSRFYDAVADKAIKVRLHPALEVAVAGARKRVSGERWYFGRSNASLDISPLIALVLAYDLAMASARKAEPFIIFR